MSLNVNRYQQRRETAALMAWLVGGLLLGASMAVLLLYLFNQSVP